MSLVVHRGKCLFQLRHPSIPSAMRSSVSTFASVALAAATGVSGIELDVNSTSSVYDAAQMIATNVMARYQNSSAAPGLFGQPYYFWEAGLAWDAMINYASATGDSQWNDMIAENILFQKGPDNDFMPPNQTKNLGNDDQARWALAAMTAAERGFPLPEDAGVGNWSELAINVWNSQVARWDNSTCGGGLRWQIFPFNNGYDYKNSFSNGEFVQLGTRLARYTGNDTYIDWARDAARWTVDVGLIDQEGRVLDGTSSAQNCSQFNHIQWTASTGAYLSGSAYAANYVSNDDIVYSYPGFMRLTCFPSFWGTRRERFVGQDTNPFSFSPPMPPSSMMVSCMRLPANQT